jgi:hypothetical protein
MPTITRPANYYETEYHLSGSGTPEGYAYEETLEGLQVSHPDEIANDGELLGDVDMGTLAHLLRAKGIHASVYMTGGNCGGLYVGTPVAIPSTNLDYPFGGEAEPVTCGPGTYHDRYGRSTSSLHEFSVGLNWDVFGEDNDYLMVAETGATSHSQIAALIALYAPGTVPGNDAIEALGLDGSLRSTPGWLADDIARIAQACAEHNRLNKIRHEQAAAARSYIPTGY